MPAGFFTGEGEVWMWLIELACGPTPEREIAAIDRWLEPLASEIALADKLNGNNSSIYSTVSTLYRNETILQHGICLIKGTVAWDFWTLFFPWINRPWGMIKVSIFNFPIFGEFNELLANSVLLSAFLMRKVKIGSSVNPNFFSS